MRKLTKANYKVLKPVDKLAIHKFVIRAWKGGNIKYFYATDMKEARSWMKGKGARNWYFEIFKASHQLESVYFYE